MPPAIQLRTSIPGPASQALLTRRSRAVPRGVPATLPIAVAHAEGALLTDVDGNRLIDFFGGIGVLNVGHRHPRVVDAVRAQLDRFAHVCFPIVSYEPYIALAERLNAITPGSHDKRTLLLNTGAEAIENAIKVARTFTARSAVVAFDHGFHGRTNLTLALTSKVRPYKAGFGPFAPEVYHLPYPYCYRCAAGPRAGTCCLADGEALARQFATTVDPASVAAIVMELELGEGGFVPAPAAYVRALAAFAKQHGIVLIIDEIQTGFGRTGRMFACDHYDLVPDIIVTAKSLAGGLPLAAVTGTAEILESAPVGGLGGTYGGNPLACAAALAVLDVMSTDATTTRGCHVGERIHSRLRALAESDSGIGDVRGLGAMVGFELVQDRETKTPDAVRAGRIAAEALQRGLVIITCGTFGNVVRCLVPLTVTDAVLAEGLDVLAAAIAATR